MIPKIWFLPDIHNFCICRFSTRRTKPNLIILSAFKPTLEPILRPETSSKFNNKNGLSTVSLCQRVLLPHDRMYEILHIHLPHKLCFVTLVRDDCPSAFIGDIGRFTFSRKTASVRIDRDIQNSIFTTKQGNVQVGYCNRGCCHFVHIACIRMPLRTASTPFDLFQSVLFENCGSETSLCYGGRRWLCILCFQSQESV